MWLSSRLHGEQGHLTCCVREVIGSISVGDADFFLCPTLVAYWSIHLSHTFPSLKFTIFLPYHVLVSCYCLFVYFFRRDKKKKIGKKITSYSMSSRSSLDRAPAPLFGGHGFGSCRIRFFLGPTFVSCWSMRLSHFIGELYHLYSFIFPKKFDYHPWTAHWQQLISVIFSFPFAIIFPALIINTQIWSN